VPVRGSPSQSPLTNLGGLDRWLRLIAGAACAVAALSGWIGGIAGTALLLFAWVPLVTGLVGWCPFYTLFGVSTRRR
jgi:hypothetical protein